MVKTLPLGLMHENNSVAQAVQTNRINVFITIFAIYVDCSRTIGQVVNGGPMLDTFQDFLFA